MLNDFTKILAEIIVNTLNYGREASFWLILGFLFAGFLKVFIPSDFLYKYLGKGSFRSIFMATLLGIPLPLCSCGVIPTGIGLYRQGVSKASTLAFFYIYTCNNGYNHNDFCRYAWLEVYYCRNSNMFWCGFLNGDACTVSSRKRGS